MDRLVPQPLIDLLRPERFFTNGGKVSSDGLNIHFSDVLFGGIYGDYLLLVCNGFVTGSDHGAKLQYFRMVALSESYIAKVFIQNSFNSSCQQILGSRDSQA